MPTRVSMPLVSMLHVSAGRRPHSGTNPTADAVTFLFTHCFSTIRRSMR